MTPDLPRPETHADHEPPPGATTTGTWNDLTYTASAGWLVLREKEKPTAEIFSVAYLVRDAAAERPVTFVFNGGPGASSAYLHLGAAGPRRVDFPADGTVPAMPPALVPNEDSWLAFTDLVLVDPVGTGFSRAVAPEAARPGAREDGDRGNTGAHGDGAEQHARQYFGTIGDLEAMSEFISRWLSENGRWGSPVFLAGESYGGYRAARLTRHLQETAGVGLNGVVLISPALEPALLNTAFGWGDYAVEPWIDALPTMAAAAAHHGRSPAFRPGTPLPYVLRAAEEFATGDYASFLTRGASMPAPDREAVLNRYADLTGLDPELVTRAEGRVRVHRFKRELLKDTRTVLDAYDATITAPDPFPDRESYEGADPTLSALGTVFTAAVNRLLRTELGVTTDRTYELLSQEVVTHWKNDDATYYFQGCAGATDDFRYGMAVHPRTRAFLTHGRHDLVTPYYTSERLRNLMRLDPRVADRLTVRHFEGGHMFYAWRESRQAFTAALGAFVAESL
ncbi:S10 family peptidase [Streptomyces flavofungini]|uniref:S10 family peptidase n=1 Tax=Streptomyces flavofungini TaxID=68200 RepID=UPI0034DF84B3